MAEMVARMAGRLRATMPFLKNTRAVLCVENNVIWVIDTFNKALVEMTDQGANFIDSSLCPSPPTALRQGLGTYSLVHANKAYGGSAPRGINRQTGDPSSDANGILNFDLNTSAAYKSLMAEHVKALLADGLLHWHRDMVCSATPDVALRGNLLRGEAADRSNLVRLRENLGVRPASVPSLDRFDHVLEEYDRLRMREAFLKQVKNIGYKTKVHHNPHTLERSVTKTITGKFKNGDKDDMSACPHSHVDFMQVHGADHKSYGSASCVRDESPPCLIKYHTLRVCAKSPSQNGERWVTMTPCACITLRVEHTDGFEFCRHGLA